MKDLFLKMYLLFWCCFRNCNHYWYYGYYNHKNIKKQSWACCI